MPTLSSEDSSSPLSEEHSLLYAARLHSKNWSLEKVQAAVSGGAGEEAGTSDDPMHFTRLRSLIEHAEMSDEDASMITGFSSVAAAAVAISRAPGARLGAPHEQTSAPHRPARGPLTRVRPLSIGGTGMTRLFTKRGGTQSLNVGPDEPSDELSAALAPAAEDGELQGIIARLRKLDAPLEDALQSRAIRLLRASCLREGGMPGGRVQVECAPLVLQARCLPPLPAAYLLPLRCVQHRAHLEETADEVFLPEAEATALLRDGMRQIAFLTYAWRERGEPDRDGATLSVCRRRARAPA